MKYKIVIPNEIFEKNNENIVITNEITDLIIHKNKTNDL